MTGPGGPGGVVDNEGRGMDTATVTAVATTITAGVSAGANAWQRAREDARGRQLRQLPPGSRLIDFGEHGIVIEVGGSRTAQMITIRVNDDGPRLTANSLPTVVTWPRRAQGWLPCGPSSSISLTLSTC